MTAFIESEQKRERVILVGVMGPHDQEWRVKDSVDELGRLVDTAGGECVRSFVFSQKTVHPGCFIGRGKAAQIAEAVVELEADTVVFDDELSPAQGRNLESIIQAKVIDRTQVILDIFAMHAVTREGRLQVELARLAYVMPRLRRMWTHLERQKGGIGLRGGPGEQQIEVDRRMVKEKMHRVRRELEGVKRHRGELRRGRRRHGWAAVSLVGYTNAGKSTLLNSLAGAEVESKDALFVTLDTTTRKIDLPNQQPALLSDTVGFISKLPHNLVEAFTATLEEVMEADLLIHVIDASSEGVDEQIEAVNRVLHDELGITNKPIIMAFNKMDRPAGSAQAGRLCRMHENSIAVSARSREGLEQLCSLIADNLRGTYEPLFLRLPITRARLLAALHESGTVTEELHGPHEYLIAARIPVELAARFREFSITREEFLVMKAEQHQPEPTEES
jgi:GTP-binding protein HflX